MQLLNIQQYLEVYRKKLSIALDEKNNILETIKKVSGVELEPQQVVIKKGILTIQSDSITKNQVYLYKTKIIDALKQNTNNNIFEIR